MLRKQLVAAIGKEVTPLDFAAYMRASTPNDASARLEWPLLSLAKWGGRGGFVRLEDQVP